MRVRKTRPLSALLNRLAWSWVARPLSKYIPVLTWIHRLLLCDHLAGTWCCHSASLSLQGLPVVCPGADSIHLNFPDNVYLFLLYYWFLYHWFINGFIIVPSKNLQDEKQYTWARTKVFLTFPFLPSFHLTVLILFLHLPEASLSFYKISASIKQRLFLSLTCLIPVLHLPLLPPSTYNGNKTHRWICTSINMELQTGVVGKGVYGKSLLHKSLTSWHTLSTNVEKTI